MAPATLSSDPARPLARLTTSTLPPSAQVTTYMETTSNTEDITTQVRALIAADLRQPIDRVPLDARLDSGELGIDSLGLIKLTVKLEETFDITMPDLAVTDAAVFGSVRDVAAFVAAQVAARQHGGAR